MAGQMVNSVTSAVTAELTSRVFSALIQRYGNDAATREKLQRLEMLLIKIHSAIEASEKRTIENSWLLQWREKLKEAASRGDDVLASFWHRVKDAQDTSSADGNQKQGEAASSSAAPATPVGALSFTRNPFPGMVQGICNAGKMLFSSGDDDMEMLNNTLGMLEKLSPGIREFVRLLHLEALPKVDQTPNSATLSTEIHGAAKKVRRAARKMGIGSSLLLSSFFDLPTTMERFEQMSAHWTKEEDESPEHFESKCEIIQEEQQQEALPRDRLEAAFSEICKAVELADNHNLECMEWLAYWDGILRDAKGQGCAILATISTHKTVNAENKELIVESDQEKDELSSFVDRLEDLARDVEYFNKLVYL